jgi:F-type H+-transporting ATPase subunit epsilon
MPDMFFTLVTPEHILFEGDVTWVQIPAHDGYVGILPHHAPMVSLTGTGIITCQRDNESDLFFTVSGGYFELHLNKITMIADVAEKIDGIDLERAEEARDRALERINSSMKDGIDIDRAKAALMRAINRINAKNKIRTLSEKDS